MVTKTKDGRVTFPFLSAEAFVSNTDKAALQSLQKIPLLPTLVRKYNELSGDRFWYVRNAAESIRCSPKQFPSLYRLLREVCHILDIPEPELYVRYNATYNAYTAGMNRTFIVLQSSLVEDFTDEELLFILGHEAGHIKCGHVLYQSLGRMLIPLLDAVGKMTLGVGQLVGTSLVAAFYEWMRQAEYSCDRAGLLACQNPHTAFSALMKLGSGSTRFNGERSVEAFLEQARQHNEIGGLDGIAKTFQFLMYDWQLSHPQVVYRGKGLDQWVQSGKYDRILSGNFAQDASGGSQLGQQVSCVRCKKTVSAIVQFCPDCGSDLREKGPTEETICADCLTPLPSGVSYCMKCGSSV